MIDGLTLQLGGLITVLAVQVGSIAYASGVVKARIDGLADRLGLVEQLLLPKRT